ncbi:MAG: helix-turn-helix transcriptional regulator [Pseudomonadota bacterium]
MLETLTDPEADNVDRLVEALIRQVGERVRAARKQNAWSRRELSERSGVSPRYLAQLEAGEGNISIGLLKRVAHALGKPVEALLGEDGQLGDETAAVAALYRRADAATRARVLQILDPERHRAQKAERICLVGLRGAGKSTLGALIAKDLGLAFVELNQEIERRAGMPVGEIIALYGQEGYRDLEATALDQVIAERERAVLAVGGGIVGDEETFARVLTRFHTIWVTTSAAEHMERVRAQGDMRPMAGNPQAMIQLRQILKSREAKYRQADYRLDTSGKPVEASRAELRDLIVADKLVQSNPG